MNDDDAAMNEPMLCRSQLVSTAAEQRRAV